MTYQIPKATESEERFNEMVQKIFDENSENVTKMIVDSYEKGRDFVSLVFSDSSCRVLKALRDVLYERFSGVDIGWENIIKRIDIEVDSSRLKVIF